MYNGLAIAISNYEFIVDLMIIQSHCVADTSFLGAKLFMVCVDRVVIQESCSNFIDGLAMMFASYYVLNIQYPQEAALTLEFIKRYFYV